MITELREEDCFVSLIKLRNYQARAVTKILEREKECKKQLIVIPSGGGKTVILSEVTKRKNQSTLILTHRNELIEQTVNMLRLFVPRKQIGIIRGKQNEYDRKVVVASVQTLSRANRLEGIKKGAFEMLIVDEAHHAVTPSYMRIINYFGFNDGEKLLLGLTATPNRSDGMELNHLFDEVVYQIPIQDMILNEHLSDVIYRFSERENTLNCLKMC